MTLNASSIYGMDENATVSTFLAPDMGADVA